MIDLGKGERGVEIGYGVFGRGQWRIYVSKLNDRIEKDLKNYEKMKDVP